MNFHVLEPSVLKLGNKSEAFLISLENKAFSGTILVLAPLIAKPFPQFTPYFFLNCSGNAIFPNKTRSLLNGSTRSLVRTFQVRGLQFLKWLQLHFSQIVKFIWCWIRRAPTYYELIHRFLPPPHRPHPPPLWLEANHCVLLKLL